MKAALLILALLPATPQDAQELLAEAREKAARKDFDHAVRLCTRVLEQDPKAAEAYGLRGSCLLNQGDPKGALRDLDRALELGAPSGALFLARGICRYRLDDFTGASLDLTNLLEVDPKVVEARRFRGLARFRLLDFRGACSDFTLALAQVPDADLQATRGWCYYGLESWDNARRDFRRALSKKPSLAPGLVPLVWAARARGGDLAAAGEELLKDLLTIPEARQPGWPQAVARFLLGQVPEKGLLEESEKIASPPVTCQVQFFIAAKEMAQGKEAAGLEALHAVLATRQSSEHSFLASRAELENRAFRKKALVMQDLEDRFKALRSSHAEFELRILAPDGQEAERENWVTFTLDLEPEAGRFLLAIPEGHKEVPKGARSYFDGSVNYYWEPGGEALKVDVGSFFDRLRRWQQAARDELDGLIPPEKPRSPSAAAQTLIVLALEGKPGPEEFGSFRFALGRGGYPCSWTRELGRETETEVRVAGEEVVVEIPSRRKRIRIDRATGFLRELEVRDYDGKRRQLVRTSFKAGQPFPAVAPPPSRPSPMDPTLFRFWSEAHRSALSEGFSEALERWGEALRTGTTVKVRELLQRWLAEYLGTIRQTFLKKAAGQFLQALLDQGVAMDDLRRDTGGYLQKFKADWKSGRAEIRKALRGQLEELGRGIATDLIEEPIDSRLHPALFRLEGEVFDFDPVERRSRPSEDDELERAFREEIERARHL